MKKLIKTILIISIAIFGAGVLFVDSAQAQPPDNLIVEFEQTPLFNEANFLPGESISRWVKVTNNSGATQRIAVEAINKNDPKHLGAVLNLEIKESGTSRYNKPLSTFFSGGEEFLSDLASGNTTQYDFIVTFYPGAGNPFQGKSLGFDLLVGFQGEEGGILPGAGGGGGGWLPPGLTIVEPVTIVEILQASATIMWDTSYLSTSQVIYSSAAENHILDLTDSTGTPPKYGYAHTTAEYNTAPKVVNHLVTITGLTPGTTYYFRAVSHASLAISGEQSFTTLMPGGEVAGVAATERKERIGGLAQGGTVGEVSTEGGTGGETPSPSPGAMVAGQETSCQQLPWWPFGYVLLLLILGTAQKMARKVSVGGIVLQIVLLIAALLWWWFEPCGAHFWVWPVLILIVFLVSFRFYLRKSSAGEMPA